MANQFSSSDLYQHYLAADYHFAFNNTDIYIRDAIKKKHNLYRDIVPISSDPPTIETDRDNLDRDNW